MVDFYQFLQQAQSASSAANWWLLIQCLQQLILGSEKTLVVMHQPELLELALVVLDAGSFDQRWQVSKLFRPLGTIAISPLSEILMDEDAEEELRWCASRILAEFDDDEAIAALVALLKTNQNEQLGAYAAAALGQIGVKAIPVLMELLVEEETRELAVLTLAQIRHSATISPLLTVVHDPQVTVRVAAIEALSSFHDSRIPPVLLDALNDVVAQVRCEAVKGLGFRADLNIELDLVNRLAARLHDFNIDVCREAAKALSRMGTDDAASHLFQALPLAPLKLQIEIVRALGWCETIDGLEYLQQALEIESPLLWQEIVTVLGRVKEPLLQKKSEFILVELLKPEHIRLHISEVKQALALALGQLGEISAIEPLILLLADVDPRVRFHAISALKNLSPVAYERLQYLATTILSPDLQIGIAQALAEW